jgi:rRNA-processing protein FCF1
LIDVDWADAKLTYVPPDFHNIVSSIVKPGMGTINYTTKDSSDNSIRCFKTLATMSLSEPIVVDSNISSIKKGERFSELLLALGESVNWCNGFRGLLFDTNVIYQGLLNSILSAETALVLKGIKNIPQKCPFYVPACVADEIYRHVIEEIKNPKGGAINPCTIRGLNGLTALAILETIDSPACYCDRALIEAAEKYNLLLITGDTGIINMAKMKNLHYIYTIPQSIEQTPSKPWQRHEILAAALQLTLNFAASVDYKKARIVVEGDSNRVQLHNKGIDRDKIKITISQVR